MFYFCAHIEHTTTITTSADQGHGVGQIEYAYHQPGPVATDPKNLHQLQLQQFGSVALTPELINNYRQGCVTLVTTIGVDNRQVVPPSFVQFADSNAVVAPADLQQQQLYLYNYAQPQQVVPSSFVLVPLKNDDDVSKSAAVGDDDNMRQNNQQQDQQQQQQQQQQLDNATTLAAATTTDALANNNGDASSSSKLVCFICGAFASGFHYGGLTCEACKLFFKRTTRRQDNYVCRDKGNCEINKLWRNKCKACRKKKCLQAGMLESLLRETAVPATHRKYYSLTPTSFGPSVIRTASRFVHRQSAVATTLDDPVPYHDRGHGNDPATRRLRQYSNNRKSAPTHRECLDGTAIEVAAPNNRSSYDNGGEAIYPWNDNSNKNVVQSCRDDDGAASAVDAIKECENMLQVLRRREPNMPTLLRDQVAGSTNVTIDFYTLSMILDEEQEADAIWPVVDGGNLIESSECPTYSTVSSPSTAATMVVSKLAEAFDRELVNTIDWAKQVPGFVELSMKDQAHLLKSTWAELLTLTTAYRSLEQFRSGDVVVGGGENYDIKLLYATDYWLDEQLARECCEATLGGSFLSDGSGGTMMTPTVLDIYNLTAHVVRQIRAVNGGAGMTADQYYLLKALVLANSDDETLLASSSSGNYRETCESSEGKQQSWNVQKFRATVVRALHTHLETTAAAATSSSSFISSSVGGDDVTTTDRRGETVVVGPASLTFAELLLCLPALRQTDRLIRQYWTRVQRENRRPERQQPAAGTEASFGAIESRASTVGGGGGVEMKNLFDEMLETCVW